MGKVKQAYLCGPMEFAKDSGEGWRKKITPELETMGYKVFDPTVKENVEATTKELHECKKRGNWPRFIEVVSEIQRIDKIAVLESAILVVRWDTRIKCYGASDEIRWALDRKIPIYSVIYGPISDESSWAVCKLKETKTFDNFTELIEGLKEGVK